MLKTLLKKIKNNQKGFTLIEALIAISILMLTITAPLYIVTLSLRSSLDSRDSITAYYLASEVIEVVRRNRDTLSFTTDKANWLNGITGSVDCITGDCILEKDSTGYVFESCNGSPCPNMTFDPDNDVVYSGPSLVATPSKFNRKLRLTKALNDNGAPNEINREVDLYVTVTWEDRGNVRTYEAKESLLNLSYKDYAR